MARARTVLLLAFWWIAAAGAALAHTDRWAFSDFTFEDRRILFTLRATIRDIADVVPIDKNGDGEISKDEIEAGGAAILGYVNGKVTVTVNGNALRAKLVGVEPPQGFDPPWPILSIDKIWFVADFTYDAPDRVREATVMSKMFDAIQHFANKGKMVRGDDEYTSFFQEPYRMVLDDAPAAGAPASGAAGKPATATAMPASPATPPAPQPAVAPPSASPTARSPMQSPTATPLAASPAPPPASSPAPPAPASAPPAPAWRSGLHHALIPGHILFMVGIGLVSASGRSLARWLACYAAASALGMGFAALGFVRVQPALSEEVFALMLAYLGIENVLLKETDGRRLLAAFGVLHGLGMGSQAGGLRSGAAFGVGWLAVTLAAGVAAYAVFSPLRNRPRFYRIAFVGAGSLLIAAVGVVLFIEQAGA